MIYYVMLIKDVSELDLHKNYHRISKDPENRDLCIYRERWQEIEYFSKLGHCLFFDGNRLRTPEGKEVVLSEGELLMPRITIPVFEQFYKRYRCITTPAAYKLINEWPLHIPEKYTKRKLIVKTMEDLQNNFQSYFDQLKDSKNRFFAKSLKKHWSYSGSIQGWKESGAGFSLELGSQDDLGMFSEFLTIKEDGMAPLTVEYRCFYFFGKLCSISRYCDYEEHVVPEHIRETALTYESEIVGKLLPEHVVIDIADTVDRGPVFLEANDVCCSGRYVMNKLETFPV